MRHDLQLEAKRERFARPGFVTGFDFFSEVRPTIGIDVFACKRGLQ